MEIKPRLNKLLAQKGITQHELSRRTGIPQGTVSRFDKNERHAARHLFTISKALDVKIEDLFEITANEEDGGN